MPIIERDNRLFVKIQINLEHSVVVQDSEWGSDSIMVHACNWHLLVANEMEFNNDKRQHSIH